jgi:hypothetical protein
MAHKERNEMFNSLEDLSSRLAATGYFIDPVMARVVYMAAKLQKPLLLEGPAGSGKTRLALAVAATAETRVERLQCYRGVTQERAIGQFDEGLRRLYLEFAKGQQEGWDTILTSLRKREFLLAGPLLRAIECDRPCVLLVDEIDKADEGFEAQAFKRASSCFGLGRYLYNLAEMWVPLNEYRQPIQFPTLPQWALPKADGRGKAHPASGPRPPAIQRGPIDQKTTDRIEGFRRILGDAIYGEIRRRAGHSRRANDIPNAQFQANAAEAMERAARGIHKANSLAEQIGEASFIAVMDRLQIESMATIPGLESLKQLVAELEQEAARSVA